MGRSYDRARMSTRAERAETKRAERRDDIAAQLVGPVEALLADGRSFAELTVDEIIERSDVPRSTFYYNFREKAELLIAISETATREIVGASYALYGLGPDVTREAFGRQVRRTVETWVPHVPLMNALAETASVSPRVREQFAAGWEAAREGVAEHIRTGQANGTLRAELDPERHAAWLTWMAERGMSQLVHPAGPKERRALSDALADIVWTVLYGTS